MQSRVKVSVAQKPWQWKTKVAKRRIYRLYLFIFFSLNLLLSLCIFLFFIVNQKRNLPTFSCNAACISLFSFTSWKNVGYICIDDGDIEDINRTQLNALDFLEHWILSVSTNRRGKSLQRGRMTMHCAMTWKILYTFLWNLHY